jgi:hypothetical protein
MTSGPRAKALYVTIIAGNRETVDGLQGYLQRAGVASHTTRALGDASMIPPATTAVVLFPDDFGDADVVKRIASLRSARPELLLVLITSDGRRLSAALGSDPKSPPPIVFPKPAFGWDILDAIRARGAFARAT